MKDAAVEDLQTGVTDAMRDLVRAAGLSANDLGDAPGIIIVQGNPPWAVAAVETYGSYGLVRSVAVAKHARRKGLGRNMIERLEAACDSITDLYLLTETAETFFGGMGYGKIERAEVPAQVRASSEFSGSCCASAAVMHKSIG